MDQKARVNLVHVTGLGRTRDLVAKKIIEKVFNSNTIGDIIRNASNSKQQLLSLGLRNVDFEIDTAKGPGVTNYDYDLKFNLKENRRLAGGFYTTFGNRNDGKVNLQLNSPNLLGAGERVSLGYEHSMSKRDSSIYMEFLKPLAPWSFNQPSVSLTGYQTDQSINVSSFNEVDRGIDADFSYKISPYLTLKTSLQNVWRQISPSDRDTPIKVREESGHSLKSSVKGVLTFDSRDEKVFSSRGVLARLILEYAGLYGNVGFFKQELELSYFKRLPYFNSIVLQTTGTLGSLHKHENRVVCINDRFFLGGPLTLRGFKHFGIGPQDNKRPLGDTTMWLAGLHLNCPLPLLKAEWKERFRFHLFTNAGNLGNIDEANGNIYKVFNALSTNVRISHGAGLIMKLGNSAKLELNYVLPFKSQDSDLVDNGIQFGIGLSF